MAETIEPQGLSLYLQLEEGKTADLEVVARAAIEFSAAVRAIAHAVDPELDVRIDLVSGTEGSLSLNTLIRSVKKAAKDYPHIAAVVVAINSYFVGDIGRHVVERVSDRVTDRVLDKVLPEKKELTAEQQKAIDDGVERALDRRAGAGHIQRLYGQLERDPAVTGVGTTTRPSTPPPVVVPRQEFRERSDSVAHSAPESQDLVSSERVVLTQAVLEPGSRRKWRFRSVNGTEFTADMRDKAFVSRLLSGAVQVPLRSGVEMVVEIVRHQNHNGDQWNTTSTAVTEVKRVLAPAAKPHASLAETLEGDPSGDR